MVVSAVLRSAVRVMNATRRRPSDGDGHVQRSQGKILLHAVADGPANDAPREKVQCHGQIDPAFPRPDISDVARPVLVWPARGNVLLQEIRRDVDGRSARHDVDRSTDRACTCGHESRRRAICRAKQQGKGGSQCRCHLHDALRQGARISDPS